MVETQTSSSYFVNGCPKPLQQVATRVRQASERDNCGFTLVELIVITAILGVLALMAMPAYQAYINSTRNVASASDIRTIEKSISSYLLDNNKATPAATLSDMGIESMVDPWKRQYVYQVVVPGSELQDFAGLPLNTDYDLYSMGQDGASAAAKGNPANADDIARSNDGGYVGVRP